MDSEMDDKSEPRSQSLVAASADELVARSPMLARRGLEQLGAQTLLTSIMEALAMAVAATNGERPHHYLRVPRLATALAEALRMTHTEVQSVGNAALLRDIGKLVVPNDILSKAGPLTLEEFQRIRAHPQAGAEIIEGVPFPHPVAPLVQSHHERWDGKGYPTGLSGEDIPLGARILSVVDYFSALISDRAYHKAMSIEAALDLLRQEGGKALDPSVVKTFIEIYPSIAADAPSANAEQLGHQSSGRMSVFENIALAYRENNVLAEIAQTTGSSLGVADAMALLASKLSDIVPFSCCALFLVDDETGTVRCRFAVGVDAESIQGMKMQNGHGLAGWVVRDRRAVVNARPSTDFEAAGFSGNETPLRAALVCPLIFNERVIGTISAYHTEPSPYTDDHSRLLDRISTQVAGVIHNSIIFEQAQEDSLTDILTGLPNIRFMFMHLTRELERAERLKSEVSLLVMDVDNFKDINDVYGHSVGDRALSDIAGVLRAGIRPYDICVRWMSDKFIVVLSGCGGVEAERKRLELQRSVDNLLVEVRPGKALSLAISIGASVFPHDGDSYEAIFAAANGRLLKDKVRRKKSKTT